MQIFTYNPYVDHVLTFNQFWDEDPDLGDINYMQMALETIGEGERAQKSMTRVRKRGNDRNSHNTVFKRKIKNNTMGEWPERNKMF